MRSPSVIVIATQVTFILFPASISAVTIPPAPRRGLSFLSLLNWYSTGPRLDAMMRRRACINCGGWTSVVIREGMCFSFLIRCLLSFLQDQETPQDPYRSTIVHTRAFPGALYARSRTHRTIEYNYASPLLLMLPYNGLPFLVSVPSSGSRNLRLFLACTQGVHM